MEKVSIIFTQSGSLFSKLIMFFTGSKTSHVMIGYDLLDTPVCIHAGPRGVVIDTRKRALKKRRVHKEFRIEHGVHLRHAMTKLGEGYDVGGLFGFFPVWIARWLGRKIKNPFASPTAVFCSEFVLMLNQCGCIPSFDGLDPETTTPEDLLIICEQNDSFKLVHAEPKVR